MATTYDFTGNVLVRSFDSSAAAAMESVLQPDVTVGQVFMVYQIDLAACGSAAARVLDNTVDINRLCAFPYAEVSGQVLTQSFRWPMGLTVNADYTNGILVETTAAAQVRGVIHYQKAIKRV